MEPEVRIEGGSMVRVAIVAVGDMPAAQFRDYTAMLVEHTKIPLASVTPHYTEHQKSPFSQQPWDTGSLYLKFMVGGAARSPWEDFQAQRKILGVIGVCHCPNSPDVGAAYEQFLTVCKLYSSAHVNRCFAFHPTEAQIEKADEKKNEYLVMFPSTDRQQLGHHMKTLMHDFAASLLMAFESWVLHAKPVGLTTPLDSQVSLNSDEVNKKRKLGRVQKTIGDYCLLAGSPLDANAHYSTAIELARLTGDSFWHGGAIEGHVCALVLDRAAVHKDEILEQEVQFRYSEVLQLYRRATALSFELEATLKLARFLCRKELAREVVELVMGAVDGSKALLDASDRLVVNVEAARIFSALGYERKAAFYGRQVALLYQQQHSYWAAVSALQVMSLTAESYKCLSKAEGRDKQIGEWSTLQVDVLNDMLSAAVRAGDALAAWNAAAQLLRNHYPLITPNSQVALATALSMSAERLAPGTRSSNPALPFVRLSAYAPVPPEREIVKRTANKEEWWMGRTSTGPFIYTPFVAKGDANTKIPVVWIVGEPVEVHVELANPCAFEVNVESISLSVDHRVFEAFPVSVILPPNSGQMLTLSGLPLSVGEITLRGCIVRCFGVITEHLFEEITEWSTAKGTVLGDPFRNGHRGRQPALCDKVEVVQPLPLLVAQAVGGEGAAVLYEGEIREMQISLSNAGVVPVVEAHMTLIGKQLQHVVSIGHNVLEDALPLPPGAMVVVPVTLKAGPPTTNTELQAGAKPLKDAISPMLVIHYAGPSMEGTEAPPGRRVALPLQLHVQRGLCLVQARLLTMEVAANISSSLPDPSSCKQGQESGESLVKMDPYRGSWGMRLLELELWNATDVLFEITVSRKDAGDSEKLEDGECLYPTTRIDRDYSARVLIPLERFKLAGLDKASLARASASQYDVKSKDGVERQAKAELNNAIEELSSKICVQWHSGRNSAGELPIKDALREALQASVLKILLPDPLTFGFRLAKTTTTSPAVRSARDSSDIDNLPGSPRIGLQKVEADDGVVAKDSKGGIGVRELTPIEMLVRNNTNEAMKMTLNVTCRDVTGSSCLGATGSKATVLWAGTLHGVVEVGALGEVVHRFALCFLVPGQYTLLGSAHITSKPPHEPLSYTGPPFAVHVGGLELGEDVETSLLRLETQFYAHVEQRKLLTFSCGKEKRQKPSEPNYSNVRKRGKKYNSQGHVTAAQQKSADQGSSQQRQGQGAGKVIKDKKYKAPGEARGTEKAPWRVYYDGASVMDRTQSGSGALLQDHDGMTVDEASQYVGAQSMNVADYVGLIEGLRLAHLWNVDNLVCYGDSLVVHKQVLERWRARERKMVFLKGIVQQFLGVFTSVRFVHIKRRHNLHAARLAHEAITRQFEKEAASVSESEDEKEPTKGTDELSDEDYYEHPRGIKKDSPSSTRRTKSRRKHATSKLSLENRN